MTDIKKLDPHLQAALKALSDKKALNIMLIDVKGISTITDSIIIAEGFVDRHAIALAGAVEFELKTLGRFASKIEGLHSGEWVVLDYFEFMVHIFAPGYRDRYDLEKLWPEAKVVNIEGLVPLQLEAYND
jgi:ribosome-associated protein